MPIDKPAYMPHRHDERYLGLTESTRSSIRAADVAVSPSPTTAGRRSVLSFTCRQHAPGRCRERRERDSPSTRQAYEEMPDLRHRCHYL